MQNVLDETERVQILRALDQSKGIVSGPHRRRGPAGDEAVDAAIPHAEAGHPRFANFLELRTASARPSKHRSKVCDT